MNKAQLISLVKKSLGEDGRLGDRTVAIAIGVVWQEVIKDLFYKTPGKLEFYTRPYPGVEVLQDEATEEYYSLLPEEIIQDVSSEEGVRSIRLKGQDKIDFVPLDISPGWIGNTDAGLIISVIGYRVKQDRVVYYNMKEDIDTVIMDLVVPFEKWEMTDPVNLPQGASMKIVALTMELLKSTPWVDPKRRNVNIEMK